MNEANYASLSSGLLARKGQAAPAMRRQSESFGSDDDLGWNDMGGDMLTPEQRIALMPAPLVSQPQPRPVHVADVAVPSPVAEQQKQIVSELEAAPVIAAAQPAPQPQIVMVPAVVVQTPPRPRAAAGSKAKAAFTLRLEPDRHMQLRLACVYGRKSAQQLVIAALDEYLSAHFPDAAKGSKKAAAN